MANFFNTVAKDLEAQIGNAIDDLVANAYEGAPAAVVGLKLLEASGIDVSKVLKMSIEQAVRKASPAPITHDVQLLHAAQQAKEIHAGSEDSRTSPEAPVLRRCEHAVESDSVARVAPNGGDGPPWS